MTMAVYVYELKEKFILTIVFIYDGCIREWQWQCHSLWIKREIHFDNYIYLWWLLIDCNYLMKVLNTAGGLRNNHSKS